MEDVKTVLVAPADIYPTVLFRASRRLLTLDHFGVPYEVVDTSSRGEPALERLESIEGGRVLLWPRRPVGDSSPVTAALVTRTEPSIPMFGNLVTDDAARDLLDKQGGSWVRAIPVRAATGEHVASIWRRGDGSVFLPFDPDEVRLNYLSERYQAIARGTGGRDWRRLAALAYYRGRRLLPRAVQIWLRRCYAYLQARSRFPRWPIEPGLHDFLELVLWLVQSIAGEPVPTIAPWPNGASWALVLTHDVETQAGLDGLDPVLHLERSLGLRSSWNFVPRRRYHVSLDRVHALVADGFEVGVHGLYHDGRDLESKAVLRDRLSGMREAAELWNAVGFRAPATQRDWDLMPTMGFDYDCSYPDTDPFEPRGGGCCTWWPFFNRDMVELPMTMPQDHTLFVILRRIDEKPWIDKAEFLRGRNGLVLLDTHPDYLLDQRILQSYRKLLERYASDQSAWRALPADVSCWWRRRAESRLERLDGKWEVTGPAAGEASVELVSIDKDWFDVLGGGIIDDV